MPAINLVASKLAADTFEPVLNPEEDLPNMFTQEFSIETAPNEDASDPTLEPDSLVQNEDLGCQVDNPEDAKFYNLILSFLAINSSPRDEQVHSLAEACGIDHEVLEGHIYSLLAWMTEDGSLSDEGRAELMAALNCTENGEILDASVEHPEEGEFDGLPDIGPDEIQQLTEHDGDPRP
jgi:hypothetical protein